MAAPVETLKRAVEGWFSSAFGEKARFQWMENPTYWAIEFDTWLDYAMPFCFEEYAHQHRDHFPRSRQTPNLSEEEDRRRMQMRREANALRKALDTLVESLGWRVSSWDRGSFGEKTTCLLKFFPNDRIVNDPSWTNILERARRGEPLYYKAPFDLAPVRLTPGAHPFGYVVQARTIRIYPAGSIGRGRARTSDPFTADSSHLDRFFVPYGT